MGTTKKKSARERRQESLPDDAVVRTLTAIAALVGVSRWTLRSWVDDVDEDGCSSHPIARLCFWDEGVLCVRLGDWRRYIERQKRRSGGRAS